MEEFSDEEDVYELVDIDYEEEAKSSFLAQTLMTCSEGAKDKLKRKKATGQKIKRKKRRIVARTASSADLTSEQLARAYPFKINSISSSFASMIRET